MREDSRADVSLLVLEREMVGRHSRAGEVLDLTNILLVRGVLSLAADPHHLAQLGLVGVVLGVGDQVGGGAGLLQGGRVLVGSGLPTEDLNRNNMMLRLKL